MGPGCYLRWEFAPRLPDGPGPVKQPEGLGLVGLIDLLNWNDVDIRSKQVLGGK